MKGFANALIASLGFLSLPAIASSYGNPFEGQGFVSDDWQLVCDNTLTCRAAGYSEYDVEWRGSILMTLKVGEKVPTTEVLLNPWKWRTAADTITQADPLNSPAELWLNGKFYGEVKQSKLTKAQTMQLIQHAKKNTKIVFKHGRYQWQISDQGMAAILLKLDEIQGRVGSPLALVSKESANRQKLKPAKAIPKIYAAQTYPVTEYGSDNFATMSDQQKYYQQLSQHYNDKWQNKMNAWVISTLNKEDRETCYILTSDHDWFDKENEVWQFTPIDSKHTLASHPCWRGAYNFGAGYWLIDNDKPSTPKLITLSGSEYGDGEIFATHIGRGLSDCRSVKQWVWNGKDFARSSELTTGLCRLIQTGGAWQLPTYVSEVVKNK